MQAEIEGPGGRIAAKVTLIVYEDGHTANEINVAPGYSIRIRHTIVLKLQAELARAIATFRRH